MDVVVGQPSSNRGRKWLTPFRIGIVAAVLGVLLIAGGIAAWQYLNGRNKETRQVDTALAQSQDAYDKGEFVNAFNLVRNLGDDATSKGQKVRVYQAAAQAAVGAGQLEEAVKFYEMKHKLDASTIPPDAYTLGTIYERLEQPEKAIAQYKIALEYAKSTANQYGSDEAAIRAAIDALEGKE